MWKSPHLKKYKNTKENTENRHPNFETGMYRLLSKSYKGLFPFNIGTTSFIYPDHYVPNVEMLGSFLENIELLLFESTHTDALPSKQVIRELSNLAKHFNLTYNVHLPTDISVSHPDPRQQITAVETIIRVAERVAPLSPTTLTLHVPYHEASFDEDFVKRWQKRVTRNLKKILASGTAGRLISIENLDYPFEIVDPIICDLDLSVCLDCGHLWVNGDDVQSFFDTYAAKTAIIHLYGVEKKHFHGALHRLPDKLFEAALWILKRFTGTVSLELFSFENLNSSLKFLENQWEKN